MRYPPASTPAPLQQMVLLMLPLQQPDVLQLHRTKICPRCTELQPVLQCKYLPKRGIIKLQITFSVLNWTSKSDRTFFTGRDFLKNLIETVSISAFHMKDSV